MKLNSRAMPMHQSVEGEVESKGCRDQPFVMASHRPIIQEIMGPDHPIEKIHALLGRDMNKMGKHIAHLMNLMTGPIDCLSYTPRDT